MLKYVSISLLVVCSLLVAQDKRNVGGTWGQHTGPHAPDPGYWTLDWAQQGEIAAKHVASQKWRAEHAGWTIVFDPRTNLPWRAFGPGIQVASPGAGKAEIEEAAIALKDSLAAASGLDPADFTFLVAARAGRMWYVDFKQTSGGVPVVDSGLTMRIDAEGRLVLWGGRLVHPGYVPTVPQLGAEAAIANALAHLAREGFLSNGTTIDPPTASLVMHVADNRERRTPELSWLVETHTESPMAVWKVFVDATTGSVLQYWNTICEFGEGDDDGTAERTSQPLFMVSPLLASFSGTATGTTHNGVTPQSAPVPTNLADLYVNCNGTNVATDAAGMYSFNGGGATVPVTSIMSGLHSTVRNYNNTTATSGPQPSFSATGSSGTLDVVWTDTNSLVEERDALFFINKAWHNMLTHNPSEVLFSAALNTNVNYSGTCNAFWTSSPLSVNFYPAGGGCINTATEATIPIHEYGHHITITIYQSHGYGMPSVMQEGVADCCAASAVDTNIMGANWQGPGTSIRNLNNTCQYPTSCGTETHSAGLTIGGCYWHTRVQFFNAYGAAGKSLMDDYLYQHFHGSPQTAVDSLMDMLVLNDDDANLANGTPDAGKFYQGYTVQHGVPFPLALFTITHAPLRDTMDQLQNYQVHATAASTGVFPGGITSATTFYSLNGGAYAPVAMGLVGSEYVASIPVQPTGTSVSYYIDVADAGAHHGRLPTAGSYSFKTYRSQAFFFDGFEVASGWVSAQVAIQNDWQNGAPGNPSHPYDPPTAYEGTKCWGNDLSIGNFNGTYQNNVNNNLTSPTLNCTGQTNVSIVYRRWVTVEDGVYDHARLRVSNNNGATFTTVWENPTGANLIDTSWVEHTVNISALADNQAQVKVRYELVTDAGVVFGGWTIDAFSLTSGGAVVLPVTNQGSSIPGGAGDVRVSGVLGDSVVLAADVVTSPNFYSGIGTISLDAGSPSLLILYNGSQTIPASGFLDLTFTVPNLSGFTAYFEGVLVPLTAPPLLITNVLPFTIL